jgi:poly(3-hydroxybutyrate) depolymerase
MVYRSCSRAIPWVALLVAVACGGSTQGGLSPNASTGSAAGASGASSGDVGSASGSTGSGVGAATGSADMGPGSGASGGNTTASGSTSGAVGSGVNSGVGAGGSSSSAGGTGASGAAGTGATSGAASSGAVIGGDHTGPSPGCGMAPVGALSATFTNHKLPIPVCTGCSAAMANCPRDCIAPEFAPGGASSQMAKNGEDFTNRDFSIALPSNYQTSTPYPIYMGGGGCGGSPPQTGDGYGIPGDTDAIRIGLSYIGQCFADGGIQCTGSIATEPLCKNGPEIPYVRALLKWVESNFCVDMGKEFMGGGSSGGWESMTTGCGDADELRGFVSVSGGLRVNQWPCTGPMAALMVVNAGDGPNPVGPLAKISLDLDSFGSAPERDSLLMRNGCTGTATTMYSAGFPACLKYTGCPDKYPVIWCELNGGHDNTMQGVDYKNVMWSFLTSLP